MEVTPPKARYGFQISVKNIHSKTYSLLIDRYIKDPAKKNHLLRAIKTVQCRAQWALKRCDAVTASFAECMIAFTGHFLLGILQCILLAQKLRPDARTLLQQLTD
jgi:hypothetical protein